MPESSLPLRPWIVAVRGTVLERDGTPVTVDGRTHTSAHARAVVEAIAWSREHRQPDPQPDWVEVREHDAPAPST